MTNPWPARIGRFGAWTGIVEALPSSEGRELARDVEAMGYGCLWIPEAIGREAMAQSALLLGATERIVLATGIASIWGRDPFTAAAGQRTLSEAFPDRFLFGLGVSHAVVVEGLRGHRYEKPLSAMAAYLDAMDAAPYLAPRPAATGRVLAALRPGMLALARDRADGAHPYLVTVGHTQQARAALGAGPLLAPEQAVVLSDDPVEARALARAHLAIYSSLPNYTGMWMQQGFEPTDLEDGVSDRLVDALVAWGSLDAVAARLHDHLDAGADHVAIQVIAADPRATVDAYRRLAPALELRA